MTEPSVGVVVVTYNRREQLLRTLDALDAQTRPPALVVVVDNASDDGSADAVAARDGRGEVQVLTMADNLGAAAGRGRGMRHLVDEGFDLCWIVDDDSEPAPTALARLLTARACVDRCGMIGVRGGYRRAGVIRHIDSGPGPRPVGRCELPIGLVDFVHLDGAVIDCRAIAACGLPREEYFIMMEDVEYPLRLGDDGWKVVLLDEPVMNLKHMGSTGSWRLYYQTRNELLMARDRREARAYLGWMVRNIIFIYGHLRSSGRTREKLRWRALGAYDGVRNVRGRTVRPGPNDMYERVAPHPAHRSSRQR